MKLKEPLPLGQMVITTNAQRQIPMVDVEAALERHTNGDWGTLTADDWRANDEAVNNASRILSSYKSSTGIKFWIITEWDRSITTVLLPEDY
jgi:hypothetical protein